MDKELKAKWIAALRSGEYKKGRILLYDKSDDSYCCIGVLGCVANGLKGYDGAYADGEGYSKQGGMMNGYDIAKQQFGDKVSGLLTHMNDGHGEFDGSPRTFPEIAAYIEAEL